MHEEGIEMSTSNSHVVELWVELPESSVRWTEDQSRATLAGLLVELEPSILRDEIETRWGAGELAVYLAEGPLRPPPAALRLMASASLDLGRRRRPCVLRVCARDRLGPARVGLWACVVLGQALARDTGGRLIDPARGVLGGVPLEALRPASDLRVHVGRHICVPASPGLHGGYWLTSLGLHNFGVPELELQGVPQAQVENAARLMAGVGQNLIERESRWSAREPTLTLRLAELQRALGLRPTPSATGAKEWTQVGLRPRRVFDDATARLELGPPGGYRGSRRDWLAFALADLLGPPRSRRAAREVSAA